MEESFRLNDFQLAVAAWEIAGADSTADGAGSEEQKPGGKLAFCPWWRGKFKTKATFSRPRRL
jgi:hypothetical protein